MPRRGPSRGGGDTVRSRMLVQQRRQSRSVLGSLRDRQVSQATLVRYRQAVAQFFDWMQAHGHSVPDTTVGFDNMLASYAECLWQEGESRGLLASALCGLTLEVRSLHGRLKAAWHMHATWLKLEPSRRAPPLTPRLAQAFAGGFLLRGDVRTAGMIMLGFHCLMRNCEFMKLRIMDISIFPGGQGQLRLLHTKIGQRLGITEQVSVTDPWILEWLPAFLKAFPHTGRCMQLTDGQFRRTWSQIRAELGLPGADALLPRVRGFFTRLRQGQVVHRAGHPHLCDERAPRPGSALSHGARGRSDGCCAVPPPASAGKDDTASGQTWKEHF